MANGTQRITAKEMSERGVEAECFTFMLDRILEVVADELSAVMAAKELLTGKFSDLTPDQVQLGAGWLARNPSFYQTSNPAPPHLNSSEGLEREEAEQRGAEAREEQNG